MTDILLLSLEREVWPLAVRTLSGRRLLAQTYILHSRYLEFQGHLRESGHYSERALELLPDKNPPESLYVDAAIFATKALVSRGTRQGMKRGLARLRPWLPVASQPHQQAWLLSSLSSFMAEDGAIEEALALGKEALTVVKRSSLPGEWERRTYNHACLLLHIGWPADALALTANLKADTVYFAAHSSLLPVRAYLALGERAAAHDALQRSVIQINAINSPLLRAEAEALTQQFLTRRRRPSEND